MGYGAHDPDASMRLHQDLVAERQLSDSRLQDIRGLQAQLNEMKMRQHAPHHMGHTAGQEEELRRAILDERRRADNEHSVAEERLCDIRRLQTQLNELRVRAPQSQTVTLQLSQAEAKIASLQQREAALTAELQREQNKAGTHDSTQRNYDEQLRAAQGELRDMKQQYVAELSRHQQELESWQREREDYRSQEEAFAMQMRSRQEDAQQDITEQANQGRDREARLRHQADKEWTVAEDRLGEIRDLQRQVTTMHAKLTAQHNQAAEEKAQLLNQRTSEVASVKQELGQQITLLKERLEDDRKESRDRLQQVQTYERHIQELNERMAQAPEGEDQRIREIQRQLDATLAAYRTDADEASRRHKVEVRELEKKIAVERSNAEDKEELVQRAQHVAAEDRVRHKQELAALQDTHAAVLEKLQVQQEKQRELQAQKEEALRTQVSVEKQTAIDRLKELRSLQNQMKDMHSTHMEELAEQHKLREKMALDTRSREEETRRNADESIEAKERSLAERERSLLASREDAVNNALRGAVAKEEEVRREYEARTKTQQQRAKDDAEYREQEEHRRTVELTRTHQAQLEVIRVRERKAVEEAEAASDAAQRAQREAENIRHEAQQQRLEATREHDDEVRKLKVTNREVQEHSDLQRKEQVRLRREVESAKAQLLATEATREEVTHQLVALESELSRQVEIITVQKEELVAVRNENDVRISQSTEAQTRNEALQREVASFQSIVQDTRPELAKLAADNCRLQAENANLQEREQRLRAWAQNMAPLTNLG